MGGDGGSLAQLPPGEKPPTTGRATAEDASLRLSEHQPLAGAQTNRDLPPFHGPFVPIATTVGVVLRKSKFG